MNKGKDSSIVNEILETYDITQSELARQTGKTRQYICGVCQDRFPMSKELYDRLKELYPSVFPNFDFNLSGDITRNTIIQLRKFHKLSRVAFAQMVDVSPSLVSYIEKGERNVSKPLKNKIRKVFGCSNTKVETLDEFINRKDVQVLTIDKNTKYLVIKLG